MSFWMPDNCSKVYKEECRIEIDSDFNFIQFIIKCTRHSDISEDQAGFTELHNENKRGPGNILQELIDRAPLAIIDVIDGERQLKKGVVFDWEFEGVRPNRVANIWILNSTLTTTQKNNIQTAFNNRFGVGRVTVFWTR